METPTGIGTYPGKNTELSSRNPALFEEAPTTEAVGGISAGALEKAKEEAERRSSNEDTVYMEKTVLLSALDNCRMDSSKTGRADPRSREENAVTKIDPVVDYVVSAFSEVCQKIDRIHGIIERKYDLDTLLVHDAQAPDKTGAYIQTQTPEKENEENEENEGGWFGKLLHKIRASINPELTYLSEHTVLSDSAVFVPSEHPEYLGELVQGLIQQVSASARDVISVSSDILRETHGLLLDVKSTRASFSALQKQLREKEASIESLRDKLGKYKQELLHSQAQVSASRDLERAVAKIIGSISSRIPRIYSNSDKFDPNTLSLLQQELMLGDTQSLDRVLLEIENAQREAQTESRRKELALDAAVEESRQISEKKAAEKDAIIEQLKQKAEQNMQEKDKVINRQKLLIKVLHAKLTAALEKKKASAAPPSRIGDRAAPYIAELEQRINEIQQKLSSTPRSDPLFSTYMEEVEDCKRRLADFLRIK